MIKNNLRLSVFPHNGAFGWSIRLNGRTVFFEVACGGIGYATADDARAAATEAGWREASNGTAYFDHLDGKLIA